MARGPDRVIGGIAGLAGAAGVALSAAGAHAAPGAHLDTAGAMLLVHAAALVGLAVPGAASTSGRRLAAAAMVIGALLFSGDLTARALWNGPLFPMAAPAGGIVLIGAWILAALAFLVGRRGN
jgi:uncharacterized membrane protein YgdD (TMEM256/DUF423 family)